MIRRETVYLLLDQSGQRKDVRTIYSQTLLSIFKLNVVFLIELIFKNLSIKTDKLCCMLIK